ncbi:hypothetical protein DICVIV_07666 [Dictyocaulus viviparus]|uniref:rRNA-processing protein FYV7 n=1 Tax=Dictyocaulus viviparus TaxID=29172 RepID=A0A0D8XNS3_DICVI|nr:hypothetical protein DICVIV_07666 [Dictyocaulus viviparus]
MPKKKGKQSSSAEETPNDVTASGTSSPHLMKKLQKVSAYERAKKIYEKIQYEKAQEKAIRLQERERKQELLKMRVRAKRKRNKTLRRCNKKGQPNLNAQVEIILGKLEKEKK